MKLNTTSVSAAGVAMLLLVGPVLTAQAPGQQPQKPMPQEHQHPADKPVADMAAKCAAMMADHQKMMADMKAADQRLDSLVAKMNGASGQAKTDATATAVTEIVAQRKTMHEMMMKMHHASMTHMMEHMQAGPQSMAVCPMMKNMGGPM